MAHAGDAARLARRRPERLAGVILALETSCDDTCAAVVTPRRRGAGQRRLLAGRARPRSAAWCPRSPRAITSSWSTPSSTTRSRGPGATLDDVSLVAVTQGPGPRRRAARRAWPRPRGSRPRGGSRSRPVDHLQGHVAANFLAPGADGAAVPVPDRLRRAHAARPGARPPRLRGARAARSTTRRARRSTRARGCSGSAIRAGRRCRSSRWRAIRGRSRSRPPRGCPGSTSRSRA